MEDNNQENVEVVEKVETNEKTEGNKETKKFELTKNVKLIGIIAGAVIIAIIAFISIFTRSEKATVKQYLKAIEKANGTKYVSLIDWDGRQAYNSTSSNLKKFDDKYADVISNNKDKKEEVKEGKEKLKTTLEELINNRDGDKKPKFKVKDVETTTVGGSKKLTKVNVKVTVEKGGQQNTDDYTFYTIKKGLKSYIVGTNIRY